MKWIVFLFAVLVSFSTQVLGYETEEEMAYGEALESVQQSSIFNAQATLASLFGKNAVIAIPPQLAGGTVTGPLFEGSANAQAENDRNKEADDAGVRTSDPDQ